MACTVAVEESISEHYNSQIRALMELDPERYRELLQVSKWDGPCSITLQGYFRNLSMGNCIFALSFKIVFIPSNK